MLAQWRSQWTTLNVQFSDRIASTKLRPITGLKLTHRLRRWLNHSPSLSHHCMFADNWPFIWFSFILYSIAKVECIVISCYLSAHFVYNEFLVISGFDSRWCTDDDVRGGGEEGDGAWWFVECLPSPRLKYWLIKFIHEQLQLSNKSPLYIITGLVLYDFW